MSTPRTKRQFAGASANPSQRQITSFFKSGPPAPPSPQPELPPSVQANLLSVGMRVRKSVPEGYKTVGPSAFKLWTDNSPLPTPTTTRAPKANSRELLPFCGINKVGGLATQPEFEDVPELDSVPELTMSQESVESIDSDSRKRLFEEEEEVDDPREVTPGDRAMAIPRSRKNVPFKGGKGNADFPDAEFFVYDGEDVEQE